MALISDHYFTFFFLKVVIHKNMWEGESSQRRTFIINACLSPWRESQQWWYLTKKLVGYLHVVTEKLQAGLGIAESVRRQIIRQRLSFLQHVSDVKSKERAQG